MNESDPMPRPWRGLSLTLLLASVGLPAAAQRREPPEELLIGPFRVAPRLDFSFGADTNVRRADVEDSSDSYTSLGAGVVAILPFHNSTFELALQADDVEYTQNTFASDVATDASLAFDLRFGTGQRLRIRDRFERDFTQVRDPDVQESLNPEDAFFGEPFSRNELEVFYEHFDRNLRGFVMSLARGDFVYEGDQPVGLYEYRGFEGIFEYHHPLPRTMRLIGHQRIRRFNHYDPNRPDCVGVPYRREVSGNTEVGISGESRGDYLVRLGYGRFEYRRQGDFCYPVDVSGEDSSFTGLTGFARWRRPLGARTALIFIASRRPLPSNLDTYYISNDVRVIVERDVSERFNTNLELGYDENNYADPIPEDVLTCSGLRQDRRWDARATAGWDIHRLFGAQVDFTHDERNSNCEGQDYASDSITVGLRLGW
jgi:hypothetical protein